MKKLFLLTACVAAFWAPGMIGSALQLEAAFQSAEARPLVSGERVRVNKMTRDMDSAIQSFKQESPDDLQDPATAKKWQDSLNRYRDQLKRYPQLDDPDVQAANAKFQEYEQVVAAGLSGAGSASSSVTASATPAPPPPAANQTTKTETPAPKQTQASDVRPLISGERVRVKKLARDMESAMQTINKGGIAPFQDPQYAQKWQNSVQRFREALGKFPQVTDPDVMAAQAKFDEMENLVAFGIREAAKQSAELGDVQGRLRAIEAALRGARAPQWMPAPFTEDQAKAWLKVARTAKSTGQKAMKELEQIAQTAYLPVNTGTVQSGAPYDKQDVDRLYRFAQSNIQDAEEAVKMTLDTLKHQFDGQDRELEYYRNLDPDDANDRANAFLGEGSEARIYEGLDRQLAFAESLVAYQKAFGETPSDAIAARVYEIKLLRAAYGKNRLDALGDSKLPEPKSTDKARIKIAEEILAKPSYEFGEHGPIVLTTPTIVDREKQVSRAEINDVDVSLSGQITLSGTETTWNYKWKEFKFATPIKDEDGDWYIWWITAKNFSSGWERTPIGVWVSGGSTKGSLILEDNF